MTDAVIELTDRVVLITGAGRGQGAAHAALLHGLGARVALTDRDAGAVHAVGSALDAGDRVLSLRHDVGRAEDWDAVLAQLDARFGRCDVLVNNAGVLTKQRLPELDERTLRSCLEVNLIGPVLGMRAVVPLMSRHGGSIINVASTAALGGYAGALGYSAAKWGLRGASRSAAKELGALGIRVNCVCPGAIDTAMASDETRAGRGAVAGQPIRRIGRPEEVSAVIAFLASDASSYCSGQDFVVDGGQTA